jgi:hypothetical protein
VNRSARIFIRNSGSRFFSALAIAVALACAHAFGNLEPEPWPARVRDFPDETPLKITWGGFHISVHESRDAATRRADDAPPEYRFIIRNLKTDALTSFTAPSTQGAVLDRFGGYPQLELWTRRDAGLWSRHLYRFVRGQYRCVRIDDFTEVVSNARNSSIITTVPGLEERLYFVETRMPE